jgi:AmmeMemoRadiSam system protein A
MNTPLSEIEKQTLLTLARETIANALRNKPEPVVEVAALSENLREKGASFVTLTRRGNLRGCIGSLEAYQSLALDVREHAYQAAFEDYRFPPLTLAELPDIHIEISRLTTPQVLTYDNPADLPAALKPGVDGVILEDGFRRATFLPQVWEQLPNPEEFLSHLCAKMGAPADLWRKKKLGVRIYHVEEFHEQHGANA